MDKSCIPPAGLSIAPGGSRPAFRKAVVAGRFGFGNGAGYRGAIRLDARTGAIMKIFLVLAFVLAASASSATAQTFEESRAAYDRGDYDTAFRGFRRLAKQGNAGAQFFLGGMYRCGEGIPQNAVQAARWYRRAAEHGNVAAQFNLGDMYRHGEPAWSNRHICNIKPTI